MAFNTGKFVVKSQEPAPALKPAVPVAPVVEKVYITKSVDTVSNIKEPSVVVNGKVKKIGKKSAFLLDMLSLDD